MPTRLPDGRRKLSVIHLVTVLTTSFIFIGESPAAQTVTASELPGVVVDDRHAETIGEWKHSVHTRPFVDEGYLHDDNNTKGEKSVRFTANLPESGDYQVLVSYTPGKSRAQNVRVAITAADGQHTRALDQRQTPVHASAFVPLGQFAFEHGTPAVVEISNRDTTGHVIADAVQFLPADQFDAAAYDESAAERAADEAAQAAAAALRRAQRDAALRAAQAGARRLTPTDLDQELRSALGEDLHTRPLDDEGFLRRATLDLIGRQPTIDEREQFLADTSPDRREQLIERLLASPQFGDNWAKYWTDVVRYRVPEPELTFLNYEPFQAWLAEQFNRGTPWDQIAREMLTAEGKVADRPAATFVGFHQANAPRLAAETTRIFLGVQIQCAQCHDHPFVDMPRATFHQMAAFFARSEAKLPWNDSSGIEVKSKAEGEWKMPDMHDPGKPGTEMTPVFLTSVPLEEGLTDAQRRAELADRITAPDNPLFARTLVNHLWARLMGRGFCEPVDQLDEMADAVLPEVHDALAEHFVATGYDVKDVFRLVMNSASYQQSLVASPEEAPLGAGPLARRIRGDEVFRSLAAAIELEDAAASQAAATDAFRFPPPPKSTSDRVDEAFGYDPALAAEYRPRTMDQAMFMMNNDQLHRQINAERGADTVLAKLLTEETDDARAIERLFERVLGRAPSQPELEFFTQYVEKHQDRATAYEDLLWSLLNSTEFTTKR